MASCPDVRDHFIQNDVSSDDQCALTNTYAANQGWAIPARFSDRARTGRNARRPGLIEVFAVLRTGAFDVVLVPRIIRLRPDRTAPDGMSAEIRKDLGGLLSGAGDQGDVADHSTRDPQMTVGLGGSALPTVEAE